MNIELQAETPAVPGAGGLPNPVRERCLAEMSRNRPELLLLDAAGTLIEPAEPVEQVYQRHFAMRGWSTDEGVIRSGFRTTFAGLGNPDFSEGGDGDAAEREWWRKVVRRTAISAGVDPEGEDFEGCFEDLFAHYAAGSAWKIFAEVPAVLAELRSRGLKLAVVSNFDRRLHRVLAELDLAKWFDVVLTSADVSARKPSPMLLQRAMERLGSKPESTVLVGDSKSADGGAAEAAGVEVFILDRPRTTLVDWVEWLDEDFS